MKCSISTLLISISLVSITSNAGAETQYNIDLLGLTDAEHTRFDGANVSNININSSYYSPLSQSGYVVGSSLRYYDGSTFTSSYTPWLYDGNQMVRLGLTDSEHTRDDGYRRETIYGLNESGQVLGDSTRYNGTDQNLGRSTWLYDGSQTNRLGFTSGNYTRDDGYQYTNAFELNQSGQVAGESRQYINGITFSTPWLYSNGNTTTLGFNDAEHTRLGGAPSGRVFDLNNAGQAIGITNRYQGTTHMGQSAWLYNGQQSELIGLVDAEHTRLDGYRTTSPQQLNEAGYVAGMSNRYNGSNQSGTSVWLYDGLQTSNIGLVGAEHTSLTGNRSNRFQLLNESGQVTGTASRYDTSNGNWTGDSAWIYNGSQTTEIGLNDTAHTRNDGFRSNSTVALNDNGQVAGSANRYDNTNGNFQGTSVWLYNGTDTSNIGLTGTEHTRSDGHQSNEVKELNNAGQVTGQASRFGINTSSDMGQSAWVFDGNQTLELGMSGGIFTRNDGFEMTEVLSLNESGQIIGNSQRFDNSLSTGPGNSAWFFDAETSLTYTNDFSVRASDGYANSYAINLTEDGLMVGWYQLFDETDEADLGFRAFGFSVDDGFYDLSYAIDGGLNTFDIEYLQQALFANDAGQILGRAPGTNSSSYTFLATPSPVPLPASVWLFISGGIGLLAISRRKLKLK